MMYCHEPSRLALSQHLREFVTGAASGDAPAADEGSAGGRSSAADGA